MSTTLTRTNGRPPKTQQLEIQKTLREYYEKGISANTTSQLAGHNIKTVCKYFNEWSNQIKEIADMEFKNRLHSERLRYFAVLDKQLLELYNLQKNMEKNTTSRDFPYGGSYNYHFRERLSVVNMIFQIMDKKLELLSENPDIDVSKITKN